MEHNLKTRKYKDAKPFDTIQKIRSTLKEMDCFTYETCWFNMVEEIYSVRIQTQGDFGTNGKGKSREYALASAYGEFMERVQNGLYTGGYALTRMLHEKIKNKSGFYFYPDEKLIDKSDFLSLPESFLKDLENELNVKIDNYVENYFNRLEENGYHGALSVPFYDVKNKKNVYLPLNTLLGLTGSNGMCAGNTATEAIFQGICEILERYAANEIYFKRLTPPSIPRDYLKKFPEFEIIKNIEKTGIYKVIIKDFSAGKKLPCVASMIINEETKKYRLNIGSDTSFSVALSRTLSELFQGYGNSDTLKKSLLPIPEKEHSYFLSSDPASLQKREAEILQFKINGGGVFPKSLFSDTPDYEFDPTIYENGDTPYKEQTIHLIKFINELGFETYIRDVSFLGFPSYHVYIPMLSGLGRKEGNNLKAQFSSSVKNIIEIDKIEDLFFPINTIDQERIKKLITILEKDPSQLMKELLHLDIKSTNVWSKTPSSYFLIVFSYYIEDYEKSLKYLNHFINHFDIVNEPYYDAIEKLIKCKIKKYDDNKIKKILDKKFHLELVTEVLSSFSNKSNLLNGIPMPQCPNCIKCPLTNDCNTKELLNLAIKVNTSAKKNSVNQLELSNLLL